MKTELTCIICPRGCHLVVDENLNVTGNSCPRGAVYGKQEVTDPRRTVTTTVKILGSKLFRVCPCKTSDTIQKGKMMDVMKEVNKTVISVPVHIGDVLVENIAGTGVNLIATRAIEE